jgi:hypothetical protein
LHALLTQAILHPLNLTAGLGPVNQFTALGLQKSFFNMGRQGAPFFLSPAFLGVLSFESPPKHIFDACHSRRWKDAS